MEAPLYPAAQSACFTGHRDLSETAMRRAVEAVSNVVPRLVERGIVHYYAGGAIGFDLAASTTILNLKSTIPELSLTLALPCHDHMEQWRRIDRELFARVMERATRVVYVNDSYFRGCMQARNRYMVDQSSLCLSYMTVPRGGTYHTVVYAEKRGIPTINLAGEGTGEQLRFL